MTSTIVFASSTAPSPPLANASDNANDAPCASQNWWSASSSSGVSFGKRLMATTTGRWNPRTMAICFSRCAEAALKLSLALVAQALHRRHEHRNRRLDPRRRHHQVHILFKAEVRGKSRLVHHIVRQAQSDLVRDHRARSMRDISRTARNAPSPACPRWSAQDSAAGLR